MCGIAGFWQSRRRNGDPQEILRRMGESLRHRGPDDAGAFFDPETGLGFSFRRLSIIDLSREGHQPMASASGRYLIIFNGEVYNFQEIRAELGGQPWRGHSDTEVMLRAIEQWGLEAALKRFVGMFAFALWDSHERKLFLVRDRLGIKPLYYGWVDGDFVFASELKAIRCYPGFHGEVDRSVLGEYIRSGYIAAPQCIYRGLYKLKQGAVLELGEHHLQSGQRPEPRAFWSAKQVAERGLESPFRGSDSDAMAELEARLKDSVRLRMIADVPLGAFLSGGIDSSMVVALMQAQSSRPVKTYTIGFREQQYNEAAHAKRVAEHLGTEHTELYVSPQDAQAVIPGLCNMYDEPFADASQIPTFLVSKLARQSVTVSLSGDGGDELFGGYARYSQTALIWKNIGWMPAKARRAAAKTLAILPPSLMDRGLEAVRPLLRKRVPLPRPGDATRKLASSLSKKNREEVFLRVSSGWDDPGTVVRDGCEPQSVLQALTTLGSHRSLYDSMMFADLVHYLPDDVLAKVDRASMAVSLEVRVPILDHRVVEFAWTLPLRFKVRNNISKWVLRQLLYKYVPAELIERPKMGFGVPVGEWLRGPLREWAEDLLSVAALEQHGLLRHEPVREKWQEHLTGKGNWEYPLWTMLMFQDWYAKTSSGDLVSGKTGAGWR